MVTCAFLFMFSRRRYAVACAYLFKFSRRRYAGPAHIYLCFLGAGMRWPAHIYLCSLGAGMRWPVHICLCLLCAGILYPAHFWVISYRDPVSTLTMSSTRDLVASSSDFWKVPTFASKQPLPTIRQDYLVVQPLTPVGRLGPYYDNRGPTIAYHSLSPHLPISAIPLKIAFLCISPFLETDACISTTAHMHCVVFNGLSVQTRECKVCIYTLCKACSVILRVYSPCA